MKNQSFVLAQNPSLPVQQVVDAAQAGTTWAASAVILLMAALMAAALLGFVIKRN